MPVILETSAIELTYVCFVICWAPDKVPIMHMKIVRSFKTLQYSHKERYEGDHGRPGIGLRRSDHA